MAEALIRTFPHGDEIRIMVGDELLASILFRDDAAGLGVFHGHAADVYREGLDARVAPWPAGERRAAAASFRER